MRRNAQMVKIIFEFNVDAISGSNMENRTPNRSLECFVSYFKIIVAFWKINMIFLKHIVWET